MDITHFARRQMTDAQMVRLGQQIEPDIAKRAEERMKAGRKADPVDTWPQGQKTRDEVARTVGLGSASTYERGKQVIEQIEREEDAPQLLSSTAVLF